jgi:transcription termination/antitermination protein NusG
VTEEKTEIIEEIVEDAELVDQEEDEIDENANKGDWYIIQTLSNHEYKARVCLEERITGLKLEDKIFEILIPEEETIEIKDNKRVEKTRKLYPGYVFIRMELDENLWYVVKMVPGIAKIMGAQNKPQAVLDDEMLKVLRQVGIKVKKHQIDFEIGDEVKIISGPFRGYNGPVKEINHERGKLRTLLMIFGRETPAELDFDQVERQK